MVCVCGVCTVCCVILHANTLPLPLVLPPGCVSVRSVLVTGGMALLFHFSWMVAGIFWMLGIPNGTDTTPCDPELYSFGRNLAIVWGAIFLLHSVYTYFTRELH